jgi:transcriptional regulator with XRE-family HTH domain
MRLVDFDVLVNSRLYGDCTHVYGGYGMPERDPYAVLLGGKIREARQAAQMTLAQLGTEVRYSPEQTGKVEFGDRTPSDEFVTRVCEIFPDIAVVVRELYAELRKTGRTYEPWFRRWVDAEQRASMLRSWEHSQLPGLVQTEGYARAVMSDDAQVVGRIERQQVLDRGITLIALVDEYALYRPVGGPKAMRAQLEHLIDLSERPNVYIHVLPAETVVAPGLCGAFILATFDDSVPGVAYLESAADEAQITALPETVARVELLFEALRSETLPRGASRDRIQKVMNERWTS